MKKFTSLSLYILTYIDNFGYKHLLDGYKSKNIAIKQKKYYEKLNKYSIYVIEKIDYNTKTVHNTKRVRSYSEVNYNQI